MSSERLSRVEELNQKAAALSEALGTLTVAQEDAARMLGGMEDSDDILEVAAIIDLISVKEHGGQPGFYQRVIRNMCATLNDGGTYCIVREGDVPAFVNGAALDSPFLRAAYYKDNWGDIVYYEKPKPGSEGRGVFSAVADSRERYFNCGGTDKLRKFFGHESFAEITDKTAIKATSLDGAQALTTDRDHVLELFGNNVAGAANEEAQPRVFEQTEANLAVLDRMEFDEATLRQVVDGLDSDVRARLVTNVVGFLSEKEARFRSAPYETGCNTAHAYMTGDKLPGIRDYSRLVRVFSEDIPALVLEQVGVKRKAKKHTSARGGRVVYY